MTKGGVAKFDTPQILEARKSQGRTFSAMEKGIDKSYTPFVDGFYGWYGAGGSVHQWNP